MATIKEIIFWCAIFALTLFIGKKSKNYMPFPTNQEMLNSSIHSPTTLKRINKNLMDSHIESDAQQRRGEVESYNMQNDVEDYSVKPLDDVTKRRKDYSLRLQPENAAEDVVSRLNQQLGQDSEKSPADIIQEELARDEWLENYDEENRRQFFQKIQQYAKEQGIQVEFDKNYRVKSVKRIKSLGRSAY